MKLIVTGLLLLLTIAAGVLGVLLRPGHVQPAPQPANTEDREVEESPVDEPARLELTTDADEWMRFSPMRVKMRSMWMDCAVIAASQTATELDFDRLEASASDVARKARSMGDMWEGVRDHNREAANLAMKGEWFDALYQAQRTWKTCTDCHVDNRSPYALGFQPGSIEAWHETGHFTGNSYTEDIRLSAPRPWVQMMFGLLRSVNRTGDGIEARSVERVKRSTFEIHQVANEQLVWWRGVERHAENIAAIASRNRVDGIAVQYNNMTSYCAGCHAKFVPDGRRPLNPLPLPPLGE